MYVSCSFIGISNSLPTTSYVKMIDVWMIVSMVLPFCEIIFIAGKDVYQSRIANGEKNIQNIVYNTNQL